MKAQLWARVEGAAEGGQGKAASEAAGAHMLLGSMLADPHVEIPPYSFRHAAWQCILTAPTLSPVTAPVPPLTAPSQQPPYPPPHAVCLPTPLTVITTIANTTHPALHPLPATQHVCKYACSEEVPEPVDVGGEGFCVAFDPLDGSSIVDTNFAVGTIFGVWPGDKLKDITGREQAAAGMGIYGPRTVFCLAVAGYPGCHEFLLMDDGKWVHVKDTTGARKGGRSVWGE